MLQASLMPGCDVLLIDATGTTAETGPQAKQCSIQGSSFRASNETTMLIRLSTLCCYALLCSFQRLHPGSYCTMFN